MTALANESKKINSQSPQPPPQKEPKEKRTDVILRSTAQPPLDVLVPTEITRLTSMPPMDKQQLRRAVIRIIRRLLLSDLRNVPDVDPPVGRGGREHGLIVGRPCELDDFVRVGLERVEF